MFHVGSVGRSIDLCGLQAHANDTLFYIIYSKLLVLQFLNGVVSCHRLCLGAWSDHGERTGGFYACNRYEAAKQEGLVKSILCCLLIFALYLISTLSVW